MENAMQESHWDALQCTVYAVLVLENARKRTRVGMLRRRNGELAQGYVGVRRRKVVEPRYPEGMSPRQRAGC